VVAVDAQAHFHLASRAVLSITVDQDPRFEAWQVNGPGNCLVVCGPGTTGELGIWS
jgi:Family of unknown function (DUF6188)